MGVQCTCGRYLSKPHAVAQTGSWGDWYLHDVRGDCKRCGPDSRATREGDMCWWWDWDNWKWPAELEGR